MCLIVLGGLGECVPGHQGVWGLTPLGPTLKIILGVMLMTWFLDPSSHWPLYYDLAFQTHVLSLDFDHRPAHIKAIEFLPTLPFPCQCQSCFCQICSVSGCLAGCGFWRVYISMNICCMAPCCSSTVIGSWMWLQDCIFNCFYLLVELCRTMSGVFFSSVALSFRSSTFKIPYI